MAAHSGFEYYAPFRVPIYVKYFVRFQVVGSTKGEYFVFKRRRRVVLGGVGSNDPIRNRISGTVIENTTLPELANKCLPLHAFDQSSTDFGRDRAYYNTMFVVPAT